jgi:hypothetical protein
VKFQLFSPGTGSDAGFAEERAATNGVGVVARVPTFAFKRYWKWSRPMRFNLPYALPYAAVGLALALGAPAAHAQTVITTQPAPAVIAQPRMVTVPAAPIVQPVETIQTIQTVRTVRAALLPPMRRQIVTTRTITRRVMPAVPAVVAETVATAPQPLYDAAPAAVAAPVADMVAPAPVVAAPIATQPIVYRYVYEPDRILVIDPATNIAVQAIPR